MASHTTTSASLSRLSHSALLRTLALAALCAAYIQGPLVKIFDFPGAVAEMTHFGLSPAPVFAVGVILFELAMSTLVISGFYRWLGSLALGGFTIAATFIALRFWELPVGMDRAMAMNAFFEHVGLSGAFLFVAVQDLASHANPAAPTH